MAVAVEVEESLAAKFPVLLPHLDAAAASASWSSRCAPGRRQEGCRRWRGRPGCARQMVAAGVVQGLEGGGEPLGRARRPGGDAKKLADTDPELRRALLALVDPASRGDPESPLRWTTLSLRNLAAELIRHAAPGRAENGEPLLKEEGFSLQGNAKNHRGCPAPDTGRPVPVP